MNTNIEATADLIMSARHSDAFDREACEQILRDASAPSIEWLDALRSAFNEGYDKGYHDGKWVECQQDAHRAWDESETRQSVQLTVAAQPKPESWQEIAEELAHELFIDEVDQDAAKPAILSAIDRSHAAQPHSKAEESPAPYPEIPDAYKMRNLLYRIGKTIMEHEATKEGINWTLIKDDIDSLLYPVKHPIRVI